MSAAVPRAPLAAIQGRLPGLAAAGALALASGWIAGGLGDPLSRNPVLVAMLCGLLVNALFGCPQALRPGLDFTRRTLLRLGVALLGLRITVALLGALGIVPIVIAATELLVVLLVVRWVARRVLHLDAQLALLVAVGSAVCGAAAILSFAALSRGRERHAATAVTLITLAGTLALLAYPVLYLAGWLPGLDEHGFGVTVGASIFELAQVYGASASVSEGALGVATLVKLSKVLMLVPLLLVAGWRGRDDGGAGNGPARMQVPWFVIGFIAVAMVNSAIPVHPQVRAALLGSSQFMFMMTMVALGLCTRVDALRDWRLIATGAVALVLSAGIAYGLVALTSRMAVAADRQGARPTSASVPAAGPGARLFDDVGCGKCHVPALRGRHGDVVLYSDLLLHDMGPALDDKIVQGDAAGSDWRTTPLVGLSTHSRFLHDGRATSLRAAVFDHGGERPSSGSGSSNSTLRSRNGSTRSCARSDGARQRDSPANAWPGRKFSDAARHPMSGFDVGQRTHGWEVASETIFPTTRGDHRDRAPCLPSFPCRAADRAARLHVRAFRPHRRLCARRALGTRRPVAGWHGGCGLVRRGARHRLRGAAPTPAGGLGRVAGRPVRALLAAGRHRPAARSAARRQRLALSRPGRGRPVHGQWIARAAAGTRLDGRDVLGDAGSRRRNMGNPAVRRVRAHPAHRSRRADERMELEHGGQRDLA